MGLHHPWCTLNPTIPGCRFQFVSFFCLGVWRRWSFRSVCWLHQAWGTRRQAHALVGGWHGGAGGSGGARPRAAPCPPGASASGVSWAVHPAPQVSGILGSHFLGASSQMPLSWFAQAAHLTATLHSSRPPASPSTACGHSGQLWAGWLPWVCDHSLRPEPWTQLITGVTPWAPPGLGEQGLFIWGTSRGPDRGAVPCLVPVCHLLLPPQLLPEAGCCSARTGVLSVCLRWWGGSGHPRGPPERLSPLTEALPFTELLNQPRKRH